MLRFYRRKLDLTIITFLSSITILIVCTILLVLYLFKTKLDENKVEELNKIVEQEVAKEHNGSDRYESLRDRYPDLSGFVTYQYYNSKVKLPLMQAKDNDYYLYRDVLGNTSERGTPFIDYRCDVEKSLLLVLYAHNMKDLSQFGTLKEYRKEEYYKKYPYIYFETMYDEQTAYEVVAAFYSRIYPDDEKDVFRYYAYFNLETEAKYNYYIYNIKKMAIYNTGIKPEYGEKLILLSTCDYSQGIDDGRFALLARKVQNNIENQDHIDNNLEDIADIN